MFEKRWAAVSPQLFTSNGTTNGQLTVADSSLFKVKQKVDLNSNTQPVANFEIKSIPNPTTIIVGPIDTPVVSYSAVDISLYTVADGATISAIEQRRSIVPQEDLIRAKYEEEPVIAERVVIVDKHGRKIDSSNPLPTTATLSGDITVGTDGFDQNDPDSMLATGSEDGTKAGIKHALRVDNELDLRVGISDGPNKAVVDNTGQLSVSDAAAQTILTAINTQLASGILKVDDDQSQVLLTQILAALGSNDGLAIGTEDGTTSGVQHVFVNNLRQMILASANRQKTITWLDIGSRRNRRPASFQFTSATFPSITLVRQFEYTLSGVDYVLTNDNWSII